MHHNIRYVTSVFIIISALTLSGCGLREKPKSYMSYINYKTIHLYTNASSNYSTVLFRYKGQYSGTPTFKFYLDKGTFMEKLKIALNYKISNYIARAEDRSYLYAINLPQGVWKLGYIGGTTVSNGPTVRINKNSPKLLHAGDIFYGKTTASSIALEILLGSKSLEYKKDIVLFKNNFKTALTKFKHNELMKLQP